MSAVHVVVPDSVDDTSRPSGGNLYDRRVIRGLTGIGWSVLEHAVPGAWPQPDAAACTALGAVVAGIPDGSVVLVDGLVASTVPHVLVPESRRLRLVVLVHMPVDDAEHRERAVLSAAAAVVTTSAWARRRLIDRHDLRPEHVHVVLPGVDAADLATGTPTGGELLCVAAVTPGKGHDVLLAALASLTDLTWRCRVVGSLTRDPLFAGRVRGQVRAAGLDDRVSLEGPLGGDRLDRAYAAADLLVLASCAETYAMVVTEALARGLPVVASGVGGVPEALGHGPDGAPPGILVPPGDSPALAAALRSWLSDPQLRRDLRRRAAQRRPSLSGWPATSAAVSRVLAEAAE